MISGQPLILPKEGPDFGSLREEIPGQTQHSDDENCKQRPPTRIYLGFVSVQLRCRKIDLS